MRFMRGATVISLVGVFFVVSAGPGHVVSADGSSSTVDSSSTTVSGSTSTTTTTIGGTTTTTSILPATNLNDVPNAHVNWPSCSSNSVTYCVETATKVNADGSEAPAGGPSPYMNCHSNGQSGDPCLTDGSFWMEVGLSGNFTAQDLDTTYHWRVRMGKFSPDVMMLGNTQRTKVSGSAADGWRLEIWARPALKAYKNGCISAANCGDSAVAESATYQVSGYVRSLGIGSSFTMPSVPTATLRDSLRGTFITTNGMSQSWDFKEDTFRVTAVSPHFLTDGTTVTPGYVKVFLPSAYALGMQGYTSLSEITADDIALTVSSKEAKAAVTVMEGGILVDTGVTHFSAPDPTIRLKKKSETSTGVSTTTTTGLAGAATTTTAVPVATTVAARAVLKRGASKALTAIYRAKAAQKARWAASGACSIKGAKLVAKTKTGTCSVTVRVLNAKKKYVVAARKTYSVT